MRDVIEINGHIFDNMSVDKEVGFKEEAHEYIKVSDPGFKFNSVTTLLKQYEAEEFISEEMAVKCNANKKSKYYGMGVENILAKWDHASKIGTELHDYGEKLLNGEMDAIPPDDPRAKFVPQLVQDLWDQGYELAITEMLVYSDELKLAGQSDIILKKRIPGTEDYDYMIYDFKFLSEPIRKKAVFDTKKRKFKKMLHPFKYLDDCNWTHYSAQLSIYQTLTGDPAKIKEKVLVVVTTEGYEFVPCYPMRVFWDHDNVLQAIYEVWNGKWYDSRTNRLHKNKPTDIVGL